MTSPQSRRDGDDPPKTHPRKEHPDVNPIDVKATVRLATDASGAVYVVVADVAAVLLDGAALADQKPDLDPGETLRSLAAALVACADGGAS